MRFTCVYRDMSLLGTFVDFTKCLCPSCHPPYRFTFFWHRTQKGIYQETQQPIPQLHNKRKIKQWKKTLWYLITLQFYNKCRINNKKLSLACNDTQTSNLPLKNCNLFLWTLWLQVWLCDQQVWQKLQTEHAAVCHCMYRVAQKKFALACYKL